MPAGFIHACDYDQEGEVIGYNILEHACHHKYSISKRAKFSSLTDEEIIQSFNNLLHPNGKVKGCGYFTTYDRFYLRNQSFKGPYQFH